MMTVAAPDDMLHFVHERNAIWEKKTRGEHPPYTSDPIMQQYRFCNVFRELDRQTIEYHEMLNPLRDDFPLWLMNMFYCRLVARPETVRSVGLLSFNDAKNTAWYKRFMALPKPRYGTPYVFPISVIQRSTTPTRELFLIHHVPEVVPQVADDIRSWNKSSVYEGVAKVLPLFGFNLMFLWTEVLIDVAYQYPECIDLFARFPIGPGAKPTFARIAPNEDPALFVQRLGAVRIPTSITYNGNPLVLSAENWEGVGCEFRKYTNLKAGSGRKRIYRPNE